MNVHPLIVLSIYVVVVIVILSCSVQMLTSFFFLFFFTNSFTLNTHKSVAKDHQVLKINCIISLENQIRIAIKEHKERGV